MQGEELVSLIWNHPVTKFLTLRATFGPMQFLVVGALIGIILGSIYPRDNADMALHFPARMLAPFILLVWFSICMQAARLADAGVSRWFVLFTNIVPSLIYIFYEYIVLYISWFLEISPFYIIYEYGFLKHAILYAFVGAVLLFMLFAPSRLYSDMTPEKRAEKLQNREV